jgi:hypothetical protein
MLRGGQRSLHPRGTDLQHVLAVEVEAVEQVRRRARQRRSGVEVQRGVAVGDHGDPGQRRTVVDDDVFDLISGAGELSVEQLDHLCLRR